MKPYTLILIFLLAAICSVDGQSIPVNRRVDWTVAGLQVPEPMYNNVVNINNFGGNGNGIVPNDVALQAAITSLGTDSGTIYFPAGSYAFISPITLRSGLVLRGESASQTILLFNLGGAFDLITMLGNRTATTSKLTASAVKNSTAVVVNNGNLFNPGDYVKLYQNDSALVLDIFKSVGQILHIKSISGNTLTFFSQLRRNFNLSDSPRLEKLSLTTGSGVECLKIKRLDSTIMQQTNINMDYAARCWLKGVESDSANFAHVSISNSTNIAISGCYFHGAFGYGPGGQGYGISVNRTTGECLVENNVFRHLRHAMLVQSGSNGNVFTYNYSREPYKTENTPFDLSGDIVLHGNYPYANLFEENIVQNIVVDASHKTNGPFNTFFRNRAESYGVLYSNLAGDSSNAAGNEITGTGPNQGNYIMYGAGNFEYGNNVKGIILARGNNGSARPFLLLFHQAWFLTCCFNVAYYWNSQSLQHHNDTCKSKV